MIRRCMRTVLAAAVVAAVLTGCSTVIGGTPTWPGERLEKVVLKADDFPPGVTYDRIIDTPGQPDGAGAPPPMLSRPEGCSNGLTTVISETAERGPGTAAKYQVGYDGARVLMTILSFPLDLDALAEMAGRCERFEAFFDPSSAGIPITTTTLPSGEDALMLQQTMRLQGLESSVFMAFENVGSMGLFGIAFPTENPTIPVKASLPQTFVDIATRQADQLPAG